MSEIKYAHMRPGANLNEAQIKLVCELGKVEDPESVYSGCKGVTNWGPPHKPMHPGEAFMLFRRGKGFYRINLSWEESQEVMKLK